MYIYVYILSRLESSSNTILSFLVKTFPEPFPDPIFGYNGSENQKIGKSETRITDNSM